MITRFRLYRFVAISVVVYLIIHFLGGYRFPFVGKRISSQTGMTQKPQKPLEDINNDILSRMEQKPVRYVAVHNTTVIGKGIPINNVTWPYVRDYLKYTVYKRKPIKLDANKPFFEVVAPVTGASADHYGELVQSVNFFASHYQGQFSKLIFYDLGLNEEQVNEFRKRPYVIYKKFNFDKYPPHVKGLKVYSWKLLVIAEVLSEYDGAMWFDTSIKVDGDFNRLLRRLVDFNSGIFFFLRYESLGPFTHSAKAATHPAMYDYFPVTPKAARCLVDDMLPGATILVFNTADVREHITKWFCICALVKDCITPPGAQLLCPGNLYKIPRDQYAGCHRYEQALLSILVANLYDNDRKKFADLSKSGLAARVFS